MSELLAATAGLKVLVTSRTLLHLYGEYAFTVPPMTVPERAAPPPVEQLLEYEAVRLFLERATAAAPDFGVTAADASSLADICTGLDGLPLALELAAAQVTRLSLPAIQAQLTSRLNLLTDGPRDLPARQQTLRAAIGWSYDLLKREEQLLFRRLAVFMGGCTLEAVEAVGNGDERLAKGVAAPLAVLVEMNLLQRLPTPDSASRFALLETIRQYAAEILTQAEDAEDTQIHARHAHYFLDLAERAEPALRGPDQLRWFQRLEQEHDNIRAALRWLLDQGAVDEAGRFGGALLRFWVVYGHVAEGLQWLEAALTTVPATASESLTPAVQATDGWDLAVTQNIFIEQILPNEVLRGLGDAEMAHYRAPFLDPARRTPLWRWPNEVPIAGEPADVATLVTAYNHWLQQTSLPKLLVIAQPGRIIGPELIAWCQAHLTQLTIADCGPGLHFLQEDNPAAVGQAIAAWYRTL